MTLSIYTFQNIALFTALSIYAIYGSPTPDAPGMVEALIGGFLILAMGFTGIIRVVRFNPTQPLWFHAGQLLLFYGLIVGVLGGILRGQDIGAMTRDIIPFFFMCLPLFLYRAKHKHSFVLWGVLGIGFLFSLRAIGNVFPIPLPITLDGEALYYLGNSPCVLFTALFCIGMGLERLTTSLSPHHIARSAGFFALAALAILPLALSLQRASLGAIVIYIIIAMIVIFTKAPRRVVLLLIIILPIIVYAIPTITPLITDLNDKTNLVGGNMRLSEWHAVWIQINTSPINTLFGQGWGAMFSSPAVADIRVNFTHSLLSAILLKTGITGLILTIFYLAALGRVLWRYLYDRPLVMLGLAAPILIDVFLYAAYKSLDFGLILALIPLFAYDKLASPSDVVYAKEHPKHLA